MPAGLANKRATRYNTRVNPNLSIAPANESRHSARQPFIKMHGLGNHFVIVDVRTRVYRPTVSDTVRICDIRTGVGADQLLLIKKPQLSTDGQETDANMQILNIDGREAGACGNATRCVAWLLLEESGNDSVTIGTQAGALECTRAGDREVSVNMGPISSDWKLMPIREICDTLHVPVGNDLLIDPLALHIGNPHLVFFVEDLDKIDLCALAPPIQNNAMFPEQINVGAVQILSDSHIRLAVYERPGILTTACGSGACVAAMAMRLRGYSTHHRFTVDMPGGSVDIEICEDGSAVMTGPVDYCFTGTLAFATGGSS